MQRLSSFSRLKTRPYVRLSDTELYHRIAEELAAEKVIGWFQGRMEFGPRALGARSIIGDARNPKMQSVMNLKIKYRESFRPFAPSVLRERVADYFEDGRGQSLHAAGGPGASSATAHPDDRGTAALVGNRTAQGPAFGHPGGDACRLFGPDPDGPC